MAARTHLRQSTLDKLTVKPSRAFLVVELFASEVLPRYSQQSRCDMACHQAHGSPRPTNVERPLLEEANPAYGLRSPRLPHHFDIDGLQKNTFASVSVSPRIAGREKKQNHRIESLDYFKASSLPYKGSERFLRLLNEASFALTEHLSM